MTDIPPGASDIIAREQVANLLVGPVRRCPSPLRETIEADITTLLNRPACSTPSDVAAFYSEIQRLQTLIAGH